VATTRVLGSLTVAGVVESTEVRALPLRSRILASSAGVIAVSRLAALCAAAASRSGEPQQPSASSLAVTAQLPSAFCCALTWTSAAPMVPMPRTAANSELVIAFSWSLTLSAPIASASGSPQQPSASSVTLTVQLPSAACVALTSTSPGEMSIAPTAPAPAVPPMPPMPPYTAYG